MTATLEQQMAFVQQLERVERHNQERVARQTFELDRLADDGCPHTESDEQYYIFEVPGDPCPVWCEMFFDGRHVIAPTPYAGLTRALTELGRLHPGVVVDQLFYADEIAEAQEIARAGGLF